MFISYAQNFEDVMLWRALKHIERGFYVDIGAQDPRSDSVTLAFYERGWRGIHVEPVRHYAEKLRQHRKDEQVFEIAISDRAGQIEFHEIPETGLSTTSEELAHQHFGMGFSENQRQVTCLPLSVLLAQCRAEEIHFLKIDVEGHEANVIRGNDWAVRRPCIV
ncbi:MAG: FkbM family methyltransferase, partial [Sulfobacillus sp.]